MNLRAYNHAEFRSNIREGSEALRRLSALGLPQEILQESVGAGEAGRNSCDDADHPKPYPGQVAWGESNGTLRKLSRRLGWTADETGGIPRVVSPDGLIAITCCAGTSFTGRKGGIPQPKNPKGSRSIDAIERGQGLLFDELQPSRAPEQKLLYLLYYPDEDCVRCELSEPSHMLPSGLVSSWNERILLEPVLRDRGVKLLPLEAEPDIDVKVSRRSG